jgi:hypothetical protein
MNVLKHFFLYIQYGCGGEVSGVVQQQPCQYVIIRLPKSRSTWPAVSYAYPQHINMFNHFPYIQYGCGEKVSGAVQQQLCQYVIISSHHPQITQIWVNLASRVTV